jgi:cysteinyl-tRNA synthetase
MERMDRAAKSSNKSSSEPDQKAIDCLVNDLNSYNAILRLRELASLVMGVKRGVETGYEDEIEHARDVFLPTARLLGFEFAEAGKLSEELAERVNDLVTARKAARAEKNWAEADRIRDELEAMGIQLMDAKDPDTGELVTTWEVKR